MTSQTIPYPSSVLRRRVRFSLWRGLFDSPLNIVLTIFFTLLLLWVLPPLLRWLVLDATWRGNADACAVHAGACWSFIAAKLRFILFGFYPRELQWRPAFGVLGLLGLLAVTGMPRFWHQGLIPIWILALILFCFLLSGSGTDKPVSSSQWGGLALTLLMSAIGFIGGFPLGILLALGRQSDMGGLRLVCIGFIELTRGIPMIAVLYIFMLLVPMMLPDGWAIDKLWRAQIGIVLFFSAYLAEIVRAGLQALPTGQEEAARSLGLGYWQTVRLVILPQVLQSVVPALVTLAIGILQNTSLVAVIGMFDFLNASKVAAMDTNWLGFYTEAFAFSAMIYFVLCFAASRYSLWLERYLSRSRAR